MSQQTKHLYEFGPFRLDAAERLLLRDGQPLPLTNKAFDTLLVLVENSGHIVEKDDLMQRVWPDTAVEESTLSQNVFRLRRALGEDSSEHRYIETIPKHGYRFVAPVRELHSDSAALILEKHTRSRIITEHEEEQTSPQAQAEQVIAQQAAKVSKDRPSGLRLISIRVVLLVLLVGVSAALFYLWPAKTRQTGTATPIGSIAVLPFKPLVADSRDESLEIGMTDTLITRLGSIKQLTVRPTSAVRMYGALDQDPIAAGRELRVEAVLEGSIQWDRKRRVRVTARLWRVEDNSLLWSDNCVEQCDDVFALQDIISERVAAALTTTLTGAEQKLLAKHYTESSEVYQLYLKGRYFWNKRTEIGLKKAVEYFRQAISLDPRYALAYVGLADSYIVLGGLSLMSSQEANAQAKAAAMKALEIDETLADAHTALAGLDWADWAGAEREFQRALDLNPNHATARQWHAELLTALGRLDEAIEEIHRAQRIDPSSLTISAIAGQTFCFARQYDQAIEQCQKTLELDPNFFLGRFYLAWAYAGKAMYEEAIAQAKKAKQLEDTPTTLCALGHLYAVSGSKEEAQKALRVLLGISKRKYVPPYRIAKIYANLGKPDEAFKWLDKAFNAQSEEMCWLKVDPHLDPLRPDARFADLLRRVGLDQ